MRLSSSPGDPGRNAVARATGKAARGQEADGGGSSRRRAVEDGCKSIKQSPGWQEGQARALKAIRFLVALAAGAAALLFEWGAALEREGVQLLARLGRWNLARSANQARST